MLTRRDLLKFLLATPAAALVDYERLLWVPTPQIVVPQLPFVPKYYEVSIPISLDEINAVTMKQIMPGIADNFFKENALLGWLQHSSRQTVHRRPIQPNLEYR